MKTNPYHNPEVLSVEVARLRAGGVPHSESDARDLVLALGLGRPGFRARGTTGADVLADLDELLQPPVPAAPVSAPAATQPPAVGKPASSAPAPGSPAGLLAEYEAVRNDPRALSAFLADNERPLRAVLRQMDHQEIVAASAPSAARPESVSVLAEYERVRHDPIGLADFIADNGRALRRECARADSAPRLPVPDPRRDEPAKRCANAAEVRAEHARVKDSPRALSNFLKANSGLIESLLSTGQLA